MATSFPSLEQLSKPQTLDATEIAPPAIAQPTAPQRSVAATAEQPLNNPVIPQPLSNLAAQGSNISTLGQILAWVAAAKGDFRGLQAIEENKRMTALGKSLHPQMLKINDLTSKGQWDEATKLADEITGQYGPAAKELIPYLTQMQSSIKKKQEGWQALNTLYTTMKDIVKPGTVQYPFIEALGKAVKDKNYMSESLLENMLTRNAPHIQILNNQAVAMQPYSQEVQAQAIPQVAQAGKFDDFISLRIAGKYNLAGPNVMANLMNDIPVKTTTGTTIQPGSPEAAGIKKEYSDLLPLQARIDAAKTLNVDPARMWQILKESGFMGALTRTVSPQEAMNIEREYFEFEKERERVRIEAGLEVDPTKADSMGRTNVDFDPQSPTFFRELGPMTQDEVKKRGGLIGQPHKDIYEKDVKPNLASIEALNLIPTMLQGNTPATRSSQVSGAINDKISSYLRYPVTAQSEIRQNARAIFAEAINRAEGTISREEVAKLREFASNPFTTNDQLIQMAKNFKERLGMAIRRSIGGYMQPGAPTEPVLPPTVRGREPVQPQQRSRRTQQPTSTIPPELDRQLTEAEAAARRGEIAPNTTVIPPGGTAQPAPSAQPTGKTAEERVKEAWQKRKQVK